MKNNFKKALLALLAMATMGSLAACDMDALKDKLTGMLPGGSESVETSSESQKSVCEHEYADEYTCHDRACTLCGEEVEATTEHTFGDWVTIRYADCENGGSEKRTCDCGEVEERDTDALGHTYADEITCHDRTCTVDDCGYVNPASTEHEYGDWETVTDATCNQNGEDKRTCADCGNVDTKATTKDHEFNADGVCPMCEKSLKDLFMTVVGVESNVGTEEVVFDKVAGTYEISATAENDNDAYAMIPGAVLTELKKLGYNQLTFTVINPAPFPCDRNDKCKSFMLSADAAANLWSPDTAIAYWAWKEFWDAGRKVSFTVDLEKYAGRNLYIYTGQCGTYPTVIEIAEFVDCSNPNTFVLSGQNSTVNYIEGKGWHFAATDATTGYYAFISASVVQYYKSQGYNMMKVSYVNSFDLEGVTNAGNPVNSEAAILPEKAAGGNDWYYFNGLISQKAAYDEATNSYYTYVNLDSAAHDFTKDIELYFKNTDVNGNTVGNQYISAIEFVKHTEHTYTWAVTEETNCVKVGYETGTCSVCKATITRDLEEELKDHSYQWAVTTPANCKEQGVETGTCSVCGDTQTRATTGELVDHYYEWAETTPGTCKEKAVETGTCTGCGDTQTREGAYGEHTEGEWVEASQATCLKKATEQTNCTLCGEQMTREVGELGAHSYLGISCTVCGASIVNDLFAAKDANDTVTAFPAQGLWKLSSTDSANYTIMKGSVMQALKDKGYTKLTMTVTNPAPGLADDASKCKSCMIAADSTGNLWSADTAIVYHQWNTFWDAGKKFTVEIDLATYAGRDIYIYSDHCDAYATEIVITELIDYTHPEARLVAAENGAVEYIEGKGWHAYSADDTKAFYTKITATVLQYYINNGYTSLKFAFVNNLNIGYTNVGNPVNTQICILPKNAAGGKDWNYCNGFISQKCTLNAETNAYEFTVDLTNTAYDFTKDIEIYFTVADVATNKVTHFYLTEIEFLK